ncbi:MAG: hypothetical protein BA869_02920 [Desulfuromonadales bacterium C00003107]|nr:MAG: hypothetical protein BA869_02920 [Desulfuromonadales bacterium C00003107]
MDTVQFSYGKRAIFPKVKEIKRLRGGVAVYAAPFRRTAEWDSHRLPNGEGHGRPESQASARIDAEIGGKGRFWMKTN